MKRSSSPFQSIDIRGAHLANSLGRYLLYPDILFLYHIKKLGDAIAIAIDDNSHSVIR